MIGIGIHWLIAYWVALLHEKGGVSKKDLLRLCGRLTNTESYRWLDRRLQFGKRVIKESRYIYPRLEGEALEKAKKVFKTLVADGPVSDDF